MKKFSYDLIMAKLVEAKQVTIPPGFTFITVINPSDNTIEVYQGARLEQDANVKETVTVIPGYTQITIPINPATEYTFIYQSGGAVGVKKATVFFTDENLGYNGLIGNPGASGSVNIGGDSVGLARRTQLPAQLTASGNLAVEVLNTPKVAIEGGSMDVNIVQSIPLPLEGTINLSGAMEVSRIQETVSVKDTSSTLDGFTAAINSTAAPLTSQACREVILQADPDNTTAIRIGGPTHQGFKILPGAAVGFPVTNTNMLYAKADSGTQALYAIWRG